MAYLDEKVLSCFYYIAFMDYQLAERLKVVSKHLVIQPHHLQKRALNLESLADESNF